MEARSNFSNVNELLIGVRKGSVKCVFEESANSVSECCCLSCARFGLWSR